MRSRYPNEVKVTLWRLVSGRLPTLLCAVPVSHEEHFVTCDSDHFASPDPLSRSVCHCVHVITTPVSPYYSAVQNSLQVALMGRMLHGSRITNTSKAFRNAVGLYTKWNSKVISVHYCSHTLCRMTHCFIALNMGTVALPHTHLCRPPARKTH